MHDPRMMDAYFDEAWLGRFTESEDENDLTPLRRAWALALDAQRYNAGLNETPPTLSEFLGLEAADEESRSAALLGLFLVGRAHMLLFERPAFDDTLEMMERLARGGLEPRATLYLRSAQGWRSVLDGVSAADLDAFEDLAAECSRERIGELVIEANVLRTRALIQLGQLEEATALARRVSRMARTEGMPQQEYLAHLCLALVRRMEGHAHLSTRILSSIRKVAPRVWHSALDWQLYLAGEASVATDPAACLSQLIAASIDGDEAALVECRSRLDSSSDGFSDEARDVTLVADALNPHIPMAQVSRELASWAGGADARMPWGLHSVAANVASPHALLAGHSWVFASPGAPARRFTHPGIGLVRDVHRCEGTRRRHGRTELATAVLGLAGDEGIPLTKFVPAVYGFPYSAKAHDGVLRVLLHRMRKGLDGKATISREDERLLLTVQSPFIVPDPRTSEPSSDPILRAIAANPGTSAKAIAKALAVPLRTVQASLSALVTDGVCMAERVGATVEYSLEDTTFSEPTTFHGNAPTLESP